MNLPAGYTLRRAQVNDAPLIQAQRDAMFTDMGVPPEKLSPRQQAGLDWHRRLLASGGYTGLLLEHSGQVIAGAGILWTDMPPNPDTDSSVRAYIMNVYVHPEHRGQRLAEWLMQAVLDECRARQVHIVTLTASDAGRPTYERLGFVPQAELKLVVKV